MNIAIIPWGEEGLNNEIFNIEDCSKNRDDINMPMYLIRKYLADHDVRLDTIDLFANLLEVDYFLFFSYDLYWIEKLLRKGFAGKMIWFNAEPEVVYERNSAQGIKDTLEVFHYVMTWDEKLIDNKRIFKRNIPYYFSDKREKSALKWHEKKLLVNISGCKFSNHPDELYSARMEVISYFERNHSDEFDFYGQGWEGNKFKNYKGEVANKAKVYADYKFALSLENMRNGQGYITEKIFDCFTSGIVPVYQGASNINDYIPDDCYIHFDAFKNIDELYHYLISINEDEHRGYLNRIYNWINSNGPKAFSPERQGEYILQVCDQGFSDFNARTVIYLKIKLKLWYLKIRKIGMFIKNKIRY